MLRLLLSIRWVRNVYIFLLLSAKTDLFSIKEKYSIEGFNLIIRMASLLTSLSIKISRSIGLNVFLLYTANKIAVKVTQA